LDIGAVTPEEIAISITAELIAVRRKSERELPHMSWFQGRKLDEESGESVAETAPDHGDGK